MLFRSGHANHAPGWRIKWQWWQRQSRSQSFSTHKRSSRAFNTSTWRSTHVKRVSWRWWPWRWWDGQRPTRSPYGLSIQLDQHGHASNIHATGSLFDDRFTEPIAPQNYEGMVGMGRVEFRVKRVAERLRHIWMKGGEMIRSISQRSRPMNRRQQREREAEVENWLADSLYSRE